MKEPQCKACGQTGHYKTFCRNTARKPIAVKKPLQRTAIARKATDFKDLTPRTPLKRSPIKKTPTSERKKAVLKLDRIFSVYIRKRAIVNGVVMCVTCRRMGSWHEMQNGHFISRGKIGTRWDEINCNVQCPYCNETLNGNLQEYELYLIQAHGVGIIDTLKQRSRQRIPTTDILDLIQIYEQKLLTM